MRKILFSTILLLLSITSHAQSYIVHRSFDTQNYFSSAARELSEDDILYFESKDNMTSEYFNEKYSDDIIELTLYPTVTMLKITKGKLKELLNKGKLKSIKKIRRLHSDLVVIFDNKKYTISRGDIVQDNDSKSISVVQTLDIFLQGTNLPLVVDFEQYVNKTFRDSNHFSSKNAVEAYVVDKIFQELSSDESEERVI